jgi:hypothetical protein
MGMMMMVMFDPGPTAPARCVGRGAFAGDGAVEGRRGACPVDDARLFGRGFAVWAGMVRVGGVGGRGLRGGLG